MHYSFVFFPAWFSIIFLILSMRREGSWHEKGRGREKEREMKLFGGWRRARNGWFSNMKVFPSEPELSS
jgi:hypothetical protein